MKKKGFTLVEIIVVITLITFIGTISFFGIRLVNNNIKVSKLESIENKIYEAVSVYVETNEEVKTNLYNSKNGIYVPLNVLENEGLIDFQDIKITDKDYVLTMLGSEDKDGACIDTTTIGSWDDGNKTIYLCTTSSGTTNIQTIGGQADNISKIERERYYFKSSISLSYSYSIKPNYVIYNNKNYRILYIDTDDSLVLIHNASFDNTFDGLTQPITSCSYGKNTTVSISNYLGGCNNKNNISVHPGETNVDCYDAYKTSNKDSLAEPWFDPDMIQFYGGSNVNEMKCKETTNKKIRLKPCMKITSGTGNLDTPYIIENKCTQTN